MLRENLRESPIEELLMLYYYANRFIAKYKRVIKLARKVK